MVKNALLIAALFVAAACAHREEPAPVRPPKVFTFEPAAGNSMVVLYRNVAGFMGVGAGTVTTILVDGKALGDLAQDRYAVIEFPPGEHTINIAAISNTLVTTTAGEVRYFQVQTVGTLATVQRAPQDAQEDLNNQGEPLSEGFRYSFTGAPPAPAPANTTHL